MQNNKISELTTSKQKIKPFHKMQQIWSVIERSTESLARNIEDMSTQGYYRK